MKKGFYYAIGLLISAVILFPCLMITSTVVMCGGIYDPHLKFHLWWHKTFLVESKRFNHLMYEHYEEVAVVFTCRDDAFERFVFVLLAGSKKEYIGIQLTAEEMNEFHYGRVGLRELYCERSANEFYVGEFDGATFFAHQHAGAITDNMIPKEDMVIA